MQKTNRDGRRVGASDRGDRIAERLIIKRNRDIATRI
jgi:hypothetical protein